MLVVWLDGLLDRMGPVLRLCWWCGRSSWSGRSERNCRSVCSVQGLPALLFCGLERLPRDQRVSLGGPNLLSGEGCRCFGLTALPSSAPGRRDHFAVFA